MRSLLAVTLDLATQITPAPLLDTEMLPLNTSVMNQPNTYQSEMSVAVDPTNPLNLAGFCHRIELNSSGPAIDVYHSVDGGFTWNITTIDDGAQGIDDGKGAATKRSDPTIVFDSAGNLYIGYIHKADNSMEQVVIAKSTDHGETFTGFATIDFDSTLNGYVDKLHLASGADGPNSSNQAIYVAYTKAVSNYGAIDILIAGTNDGGESFSVPLQVSDSSADEYTHFRMFAKPSVGPNGELYVSWADHTSPIGQIVPFAASLRFDVDMDGLFEAADSFGNDILVRTLTEPLFPYESLVPAQPERGIHNGPVLDVDCSGGAFDGRLYLTWTDAFDGNFGTTHNSDVFLAWSDNQGASWTLPGTMGNVEDSSGTDFLPWVDVDQTTGSVNVIYYTTDGQPATDVFPRLATSIDGGATFAYADLSAVTTNETGGYDGDYLEYIGLAVHDGTAHGLWSARITPNSADLEAVTAAAAMTSLSGSNVLTVTGDEDGTADDVIEVRLSQVNGSYLEVLVNGTLQFAGLAATVDEIDVDGLLGVNTYVIDPVLDIPVTLPPPRIKTVIVSNSSTLESYDFRTARFDDVTTPANEDQPVTGSGNQLRTVPVGGANSVSIVFDQSVEVDASCLGVIGASALDGAPHVPTLAVNGFEYDGSSFTATWTYNAQFISKSDFYLVKVTDGSDDGTSAGISGTATGTLALDGEWTNPASIATGASAGVSVFPSGDGTAGGDFQFVFTILPDFNQDNLANSSELSIVLTYFNAMNTDFAHGDFNGSTVTNSPDLSLLLTAFNANLQTLMLEVDRSGDPFTFDQEDIDWYLQNNQENDPMYLAFAAFQGLFGDISLALAV